MNIPKNLMYTETHEWVKQLGDGKIAVGISDYAQELLGNLVFVNLPAVGDDVIAGDSFADVESVKAVSDIISPATGVVDAINETLLDSPEQINESPYEAWFVEIKDTEAALELMNAEEYAAYVEKCKEEA